MSLPLLDPHFFDDHQPTANFFQKWKDSGPWSELLLPIYEWEDCVFIGVCQSDYDEKKSYDFPFPFVLVLTPPQALKNVWDSYQKLKNQNLNQSDDPFAQLISSTSKNRPSDETIFDTISEEAPVTLAEDSSVGEAKTEEPLDLSVNLEPESPSIIPEQIPPPPIKKSDWTDSLFDKLNSHFPYSMILLVNQGEALPWKWSESFQLKEPNPIDMKKPSPFYVIYRTGQAFHGPIAPSEELQKHCSEWGMKGFPQHLTAVPVKLNNQIIGVLACFGEAELYQPSNLEFCEKCALEISMTIQKQPQLLKAA